ncbi:unnamed protein product, partial [Trichobilharzia szidati]
MSDRGFYGHPCGRGAPGGRGDRGGSDRPYGNGSRVNISGPLKKPAERGHSASCGSAWSSNAPCERGDIPSSSEGEIASEAARQKKSHPVQEAIFDMSTGISKLNIQ